MFGLSPWSRLPITIALPFPPPSATTASPTTRPAAAAAFGMILRESEHKGSATLSFSAEIAGSALGRDQSSYRAEFLDPVRQAEAVR
jgi:Ca-activated chloride channel family protein